MNTEVEAYMRGFPAETAIKLRSVHELIRLMVPEAVDCMNYGIPTFKLNGRNLVHFGGYERHIGFYPGADTMAHFQNRTSGYKQGKGSLQFPLVDPIPFDLIRQMVAFRLRNV